MNPELPPIPEAELKKHLPKRRFGPVAWITIFVISFVGLPIAGYLTWMAAARQKLERQLTKLSDATYPVSAESLTQYHEAARTADDITPLMQAALTEVAGPGFPSAAQGIPLVDFDVPVPTGPADEWTPAATQVLAQYATARELVHQAAQRAGAACYPIAFADGYQATLTHVQDLHRLVGLMLLEAHVSAAQGDLPATTDAMVAAFCAAASLRHEPVLVSQTVQSTMLDRVLDAWRTLVASGEFSIEDLSRLQHLLESMNLQQGLQRAFVGEQALTLATFRGASAQDMAEVLDLMPELRTQQAYLLTALGSRHEDLSLYCETMAPIHAAMKLPWPSAITRIDGIIAAAEQQTTGTLRELRFGITRAAIASPEAAPRIVRRVGQTAARLRVAAVALAVLRSQVSSCSLPRNLAELVPQDAKSVTDPLAPGNALRIQTDEQTFTIYSVGINQKDDGASTAKENDFSLDIAWQLPRRSASGTPQPPAAPE